MINDFLRSKFMVLCLGTSIIFLYPVLVFPKGELELLINKFHYPAMDLIFKYITHLGDGSLLALLLVAVLFYKYYTAILVAFSILFQSIIISIFKKGIYKGLERPVAFFDESVSLNFVDGVDVHSINTFPSGHTATGFAIFALLFIIINNRGIAMSTFLFVLAFLVGFSRVYILQHFVIDAYFGAIFGILSVLLGLYFMRILFNDTKLEAFKTSSLRTTFKKSNRS
jgi:membrane-associated phospholipid phosphatase